MSHNNEEGPLPQSDRNRALQTLSFKALNRMLNDELFLLRDERVDDAGVDATLELLSNGCYTNMRAQVQLKGTDSTDSNRDGSISLQVDTSNLNYLLNGASPLYILYIAPRDELRFLWSRDECWRIEQSNAQLKKQQTITLRFVHILTESALQDIHERIRSESKLSRDIYEILGRASTTEQITVGIHRDTLATTDPYELVRLLNQSGLSFVSAGYITEVLDLMEYLNSQDARQPRILLVRAYAEYALSRYQEAFATSSRVLVQVDELQSSDQQFLHYLRAACEFHTGRIAQDTYLHRIDILTQQDEGIFALIARLEHYRHALHNEQDHTQYIALIVHLRTVVAHISAHHDASATLKLQARIILLYAEGRLAAQESFQELHHFKMRQVMGFEVDREYLLQTELVRWKSWMDTTSQAMEQARLYGHPVLLGEAMLTWVKILTARLMNRRHIARTDLLITMTSEDVYPLRAMAEQAEQLYAQIKHLEGQLRAQLIRADVHMLLAGEDAAKKIAQEVLPQAQAMEYHPLISWAGAFLNQSTVWDQAKAMFAHMEQEDEDVSMAARSDDDIRIFAQDVLASLNLPVARLGIVERDAHSLRDIAQERLTWCRHIELIQDLHHTAHLESVYTKDPERFVCCLRHKYQTRIISTNWKALISAFKQTYCAGCPDQDPKQNNV